ncbi:uncharacterized protein LOC119731342 isoform X2 [Patiria miniata]|uniref:USP domain-containing protein n=1 Tax=Patiria miniata TaxID=46514 RepID=A0A914A9C3_PATMI|nr:uncharacterized protein LOC119731342 isoform X2 [Patiria miniata]
MASLYQSLASRSKQTTARVWQPRNTSSVIFSKGLLNAPGENNCFLNSAVQVLWHLDVFRRSFREMGGHACMGKACIFCALKVLFTQLRYSEKQSLPPDALRKAMAVAFQDEHRFQLGCMDDAAECFENILTRIHFHLAHDIKEELCDAKYCIPHRKFAMTLIEHSVCTCGATSEPFPFTQMVHYVSCTAICTEAKKLRERHHWSSSVCFGHVLRNAGAVGDIRDCPSECGKKINIRRVLMNCPDVVAIGLVWDSDRPEKDHIVDVIQCLGTSLRMPDLFNSVVDEKAKRAALHLVGVVTYYGKHYSTFFYNTALRLWVYFDDATVKQVGPNWRDVVNRCKRGHSQPLLLLFANPDGTPVPTEMAPKESTVLPGYTQLKSPTDKNSRAHPARDPRSTSNLSKYQPMQPVVEYKPVYASQDTAAPGQKHVVEIGHDAVQKLQTRRDGGHSTSQNSQSSVHKRPGSYAGKTSVRENEGSYRTLQKPLTSNQLSTDTTSTVPNSSSVAQSRTKMQGDQRHSLADDLMMSSRYPHQSEEVTGNVSLTRSQGFPVSDMHVASPIVPRGDRNDRSTHPLHRMTAVTQMPHPKKLERHESWSGRPSHTMGLASQSRRNIDNKYTVQRHSSFSNGTLPDSQPRTVPTSIPDRQPISGQTNRLANMMPPHKALPIAGFPTNQTKAQFGSVPNLHQGFDLRAGKSVSVQNIALAEEGILASAIKNNIQQKRSSTSDVSLGSSNGHQSQQGRNGVTSDQELSLAARTDRYGYDSILKPDKQNINQDQAKQRNMQRIDRDYDKSESLVRNTSSQGLQHTDNSHSTSVDPKTSRRGLVSGQSLQNRDSVASRDSGYRSRDRSSASSGSVYSIETPTSTRTGYPLDSVDTARESTQQMQTDGYDYQASSGLQDVDTVCDEICAECADLEAQSRLKGDAGDLATALALCTASVTKLKECLKLDGISSQKRQLLHSRYNTAVLQSRNLHRRLTILRDLDAYPVGQKDTSPASPSQPPLVAKDLNLINLQEASDDSSRVDRLKQQLQELYMQDKGSQSAKQENYGGLAMRPNQSQVTHTHIHVPRSRMSADVFVNDRKTLDNLRSCDAHSRMTSLNRNQNAGRESYVANNWLSYSSQLLGGENTEKAPVCAWQKYGIHGSEDGMNSMSRQSTHEDTGTRRNGVTQPGMPGMPGMHEDTRRNNVTGTQQTYGQVRSLSQPFTAHTSNVHNGRPRGSAFRPDVVTPMTYSDISSCTQTFTNSSVRECHLDSQTSLGTRLCRASAVPSMVACKAYCTEVPTPKPASHPNPGNKELIDKTNALMDKNLEELISEHDWY